MNQFSAMDPIREHLCPKYTNLPEGRYIHIFLLRETRSEAVFRTEGTGEPLCREQIDFQGDGKSQEHVVITKRKQVAVERRTGREMLRRYGLLRAPKKPKFDGEMCLLNSNNPCERCIDCWLYGFAAGGGGAQRSRILSEDAFSLLPANEIVDTRTGNATYDNGTMRHPVTGKPSQALYESEYVKPQSVFLDVQTLKDVQEAEFAYVLGNILRSTRYGATGTRIGHVHNRVLAIAGADHEVTSNLLWTAQTQRALRETDINMTHPLVAERVAQIATQCAVALGEGAMGRCDVIVGKALDALLTQVREAYKDPNAWLTPLAESFDALAKQFEAQKKSQKKGKK